MGAWSTSILGDDFASDVHSDFMDAYNDGADLKAIRASLEQECSNEVADPDEGPVFWLALAKAQWDCGALEADVLERVKQIVERGLGLDRWADEPARDLVKRKKVLTEFYTKLQTPRLNPKRRRKLRLKPAIFAAGDCLILTLPSGAYGAAVVLVANNNHRTEGENLVGVLHYRSPHKPPMEIFEASNWLVLNHHGWRNEPWIIWCLASQFRDRKLEIEVCGTLKQVPSPPREIRNLAYGWDGLASSVDEQFDWETGKRD